MIVQEKLGKFIRTYSDENKYIRRVGTESTYSEAIDVIEVKYEETNIVIEPLLDEYEVPEQDF